jgi:hypothetical protein
MQLKREYCALSNPRRVLIYGDAACYFVSRRGGSPSVRWIMAENALGLA